MHSTALFLLVLCVPFFVGCSKEEEDNLVAVACDGSNLAYNTGISAIINPNCNNSNCHNSGSPHGDFTTFAGMQGVINNGTLNQEVLVNQTMPQGSATLTSNQLNKLKCWVDNGFPEN